MKEKIKKILTTMPIFKSFIPAILVAAIIVSTLSQYQVPVFEAKAIESISDTAVAEESQQLERSTAKETEEESVSKGTFDVEDGTYKGSASGYGGDITVSVTVKDKTITSIEILSAPGEDEPFFSRAKGLIDTILKKQSLDVDVVSGASYSSRGIIGAIKNALYNEVSTNPQPATTAAPETLASVSEKGTYKDGTYTGSAKGFGGNITVQVTIKNGKMTAIRIVSASGEDTAYLNKAKTLINTMLKKQSTNVDTVSGATYSSTGIINAVRKALAKASTSETTEEIQEVESAEETTSKKTKSTQAETVKESGTYKDGTYKGSGTGFGGTIKVQVVIKNQKIKSIKILEAKHEDTAFLNKAKTLLNVIVKKQTTNVDVVTGATYSSNGIIEAVRNALSKAKVTSNSNTNKDKKETKSQTENQTQAQTQKFPYKDGIYYGTGTGFGGDITVAVVIQNYKIQTILMTEYEDDEPFITKASAILDTVVKKQSTNVDIVSGATFSSKGILEAIKNALAEAKKATNGTTSESENKEKDTTEASNEEPTTTDTQEEDSSTEDNNPLAYNNGTYTVAVTCEPDEDWDFDEYKISFNITIQNDHITNITVASSGDTSMKSWYNAAVKGILSQIKSNGSDSSLNSIDVVSGATCSSDAVIEACKLAFSKAKK